MSLPMKVETAYVNFWNTSKMLENVKSSKELASKEQLYLKHKESRKILINWLQSCYEVEFER